MTAPYFDSNIPLGQRQFYAFTRESLAAINRRIAEKTARRKSSCKDDQQVSLTRFSSLLQHIHCRSGRSRLTN
jgi:hypothetical protein